MELSRGMRYSVMCNELWEKMGCFILEQVMNEILMQTVFKGCFQGLLLGLNFVGVRENRSRNTSIKIL